MDSTRRRAARDLHYHMVCADKLRFAVPERRKRHTYLNAGLAIQVKPCTGVLGFCWETSIFGVWFGHNFSFLECGLLWSVVRVSCGSFCSFSFFFLGDPPGD